MIFSICVGKKNAEVIKFLRILKNKSLKIKFIKRQKSNVLLNKKVIFCFHTIFKLDFIMQINESMNPEYITGQINSRILELLLRQFCCLIFALSQKY